MHDNPAYELFDELGRGENSVVYRGYDLDLGRDVAIKELNEQSRKDARRAGQFLKEASFLAQFEHENILRIYSVDKERGWIVMELMKGTLASEIAITPLAADTVRSVLRQILGALDFLHQKNKVHGAVRPSNILVNELGTAKLSDFEAADPAAELRAPTGSKKHLAPELIRPEFGEFGPGVDLYCLGFTALELLTGAKFESLFPGTGQGAIDADVAWLRWHSSEESLPPVKQLCPNVPDDLANVIDQLLAKQVDHRPSSAKEVLELLSEQDFIPVLVSTPTTASVAATAASPTASVDERGQPASAKVRRANSDAKKSKSRKSRKAVGVVSSKTNKTTKDKVNDFLGKPYVLWPLCAAMLIGAVFIGLQLQGTDDALAKSGPETSPPAVAPITLPEPQLTDVRFRITPDWDGVRMFLNGEDRPLAEGESISLAAGEYALAITKDGFEDHRETLVVNDGSKLVEVSLQPLAQPPSQQASVRLMISPDRNNASIQVDGQAIATNETGILQTQPGTHQLTIHKDGYEPYTQTIRVAAGEQDLAITLRALPGAAVSNVVKVAVNMPAGAEFQFGDSVVRFPNAQSSRIDFEVEHRRDDEFSYRVTAEGYEPVTRSIPWEKLLAARLNVRVALTPIEDLATQTPSNEEANIEEPTLDKEQLTSEIDPVQIVDPLETIFVNAADSSKVHETKSAEIAKQFTGKAQLVIDSGGFLDELTDVSFSPDGKLLAAAGGKVVRIWSVETGKLIATLRGDRSRTSYGNVFAASFSPDGKTLLVGISDYEQHGSIREYSTADFTELQRLVPGHTAPCRQICFSGSGQRRITADADGNLLIVGNADDQLIGKVTAADPLQPLFEMISYPDKTSDVILALDAQGPKVFSPSGQPVTSPNQLPDKVLGWLLDVFNKKVQYPFGAAKDPRVLDFALERNEWAAAGVSLVEGKNKFWAAIFASRGAKQTTTASAPLQVYSGHRWSITCIELGPNQKLAATGDKFGEVHLWNRNTGKLVHKFAGQGKSIYEVGFDENSNRIAFGTRPFKPGVWNRNNYGHATRVLDLRQRAILPREAADDLRLSDERTQAGPMQVDVSKSKQDPSFFVNLKQNGRVLSQYKVSSARNPTVYSLIDQPKLGVKTPVVFGDSEGLLALWDTSTDELRRAFLGHGSLVSGVSFSRNGKLMVSASADRTIRIWSLEDHIPTGTFDFKFENTSVLRVVPGSSSAKAGVQIGDEILTMDGLSIADIHNKMLDQEFEYRPGQVVPMRMKRDGREYTFNMTMAEGYDFVDPTLSFYIGDQDQWIIWSPAGYYDASPGADQLIGWHVNRGPAKSAKFYAAQQFQRSHYRPDVIDLILDGHKVQDAVRLGNERRNRVVEQQDLRALDQIAKLLPPEVTILSPLTDGQAGGQTTNKIVQFSARVESPNGLPIQEATLLHNGSAIKVFRPLQLQSDAMDVLHQVQLVAGENRLELLATNGKTSSQAVGVNITLKSTQPAKTGDVHVLAVGISSYATPTDDLQKLRYASSDAQSFAETVSRQKNGKLYRNVHVRTLTNGEASRSNILDGFQWLVDNVKPNDSAIVFFSGYAFVDSRENFYLASHEADAKRLRATAISWREIIDLLHSDLPACQRFVFLDARPTAGGLTPGMRNPLLDLAAPELGTTFFASNTLQQLSDEVSRTENGVFMQAIIDTLKDSKSDVMPNPRDQLINPAELASSIRTRVQKASEGRQLPTFFASTQRQRNRNLLELDPANQTQ